MSRKKVDGRSNNSRPEGSYKYNHATEVAVAKLLRQHGLTGAYEYLKAHAVKGVRRCGVDKGKTERVELSVPALQQLAVRRGVKFQRGRRKVA